MQRGQLLIVLGIILGLATVYAVVFLVLFGDSFSIEESTPEARPLPTKVLIALKPIPRGFEFVEGSIGGRERPANNIPPDVVVDETEFVGHVAQRDIAQGEVIVRDMLTDSSTLTAPPSPVAANGIVYFGRNDGFLYAVDAETSQEVWRFEAEHPNISTPAIADGLVYLVDGREQLYALKADTGDELWRFALPGSPPTLNPAPPFVAEQTVYLENRSQALLHALEAKTGRELWQFETTGLTLFTANSAVDVLYFATREGDFLTIDRKTGRVMTEQSQ